MIALPHTRGFSEGLTSLPDFIRIKIYIVELNRYAVGLIEVTIASRLLFAQPLLMPLDGPHRRPAKDCQQS
jgi:hypothetical protein